MIEVTKKDIERAEAYNKMSYGQQEASVARTKDVNKLLARGIALCEFDKFHGPGSIEYILKHDKFAVQAKLHGASPEQLQYYAETVSAAYKKNQQIREERDRQIIAKLWSEVDPKLARNIGSTSYNNYSVILPGTQKRRVVNICHDYAHDEYYFEYKKTIRSKNTTTVYMGHRHSWSPVEDAKSIINIVKKYQIMSPLN